MSKLSPKLSEEEKQRRFAAALRRHKTHLQASIYDGSEVRRIAARLFENPESVRARLREAGFELTRSSSGCRGVWKPKSQSSHTDNLED